MAPPCGVLYTGGGSELKVRERKAGRSATARACGIKKERERERRVEKGAQTGTKHDVPRKFPRYVLPVAPPGKSTSFPIYVLVGTRQRKPSQAEAKKRDKRGSGRNEKKRYR